MTESTRILQTQKFKEKTSNLINSLFLRFHDSFPIYFRFYWFLLTVIDFIESCPKLNRNTNKLIKFIKFIKGIVSDNLSIFQFSLEYKLNSSKVLFKFYSIFLVNKRTVNERRDRPVNLFE